VTATGETGTGPDVVAELRLIRAEITAIREQLAGGAGTGRAHPVTPDAGKPTSQ
jgi:hypothetical protein